jgi:DNA primase
MVRAQRVAAGRRMRLRVAAMPAGVDPAEMMAGDDGAERFRALVDAAVDLPEFQVGLVLERTDASSPAERDRALRAEVAPILAGMGESASREEQVRRVAEAFDMEPALVMGAMVSAQPTSGGGAEATAGGRPTSAPAPRTAQLTSRERRERALLAMCIALPSEGRDYLARLTEAHLTALGARAVAWLGEHLDDPATSLPHGDDELAALISELVITAHDEPASIEAMELNYLLLEQRRLEAEISSAGEREDYEGRAALSRERAALVERIARTERVGG